MASINVNSTESSVIVGSVMLVLIVRMSVEQISKLIMQLMGISDMRRCGLNTIIGSEVEAQGTTSSGWHNVCK
jgi:hypothetical protein